VSEREYDPEFIHRQREGFKFALEDNPAGEEILKILNQENSRGMHKIGGGTYMDGIS
jgi:hypothetical protein